jgi:hypothetical protein
MANYFARKAANINAADIWATTAGGSAADVYSTFTSSDVLHSNNFAVTVNVTTTVGEVRNDNANSATAGGSFTLSDSVTLTANVISGTAGAGCVIYAGSTSASIVGNVNGGNGSGRHGATNNGTGTLNVTGDVLGGFTGSNGHGANNQSTGTLNVTGDVTGGPSGSGNLGVRNLSTGTTNITGDVLGGLVTNTNYGVNNVSTGTTTIVGSSTASAIASGAFNESTGILTVTRAVGNVYGIGATGTNNVVAGLQSNVIGSDSRAGELEYGSNGAAPTMGAVKIVSGTNNKCLVTLTTSAVKTLADPSDGTGQANEADVRSGTSYALGNKTGTCAVPAAGSVALGVAVDATTGTAVLTPAAVWDALTSGMTTSGSIGARLKNAATLDSTGQQLADALSPVP